MAEKNGFEGLKKLEGVTLKISVIAYFVFLILMFVLGFLQKTEITNVLMIVAIVAAVLSAIAVMISILVGDKANKIGKTE